MISSKVIPIYCGQISDFRLFTRLSKLKKDNRLSEIEGKTFEDVLKMKIVTEARNFKTFISTHTDLFEQTKSVLFEELLKIYLTLQRYLRLFDKFTNTPSPM